MRKGSFSDGLNAFTDEAKEKAEKNVRKTLVACLAGTISRSPVDTGGFRENWNIRAKTPDDSVDEKERGKIGDKPIPASEAELSKAENVDFDVGDKVYISNALPYANRIEGGWSQQAKTGVVAPTIREVEGLIRGGALD